LHSRIEKSRIVEERELSRQELGRAVELNHELSLKNQDTSIKLQIELKKNRELNRSILKLSRAFDTVMGANLS